MKDTLKLTKTQEELGKWCLDMILMATCDNDIVEAGIIYRKALGCNCYPTNKKTVLNENKD